jgi:hypothetical protein
MVNHHTKKYVEIRFHTGIGEDKISASQFGHPYARRSVFYIG